MKVLFIFLYVRSRRKVVKKKQAESGEGKSNQKVSDVGSHKDFVISLYIALSPAQKKKAKMRETFR